MDPKILHKPKLESEVYVYLADEIRDPTEDRRKESR